MIRQTEVPLTSPAGRDYGGGEIVVIGDSGTGAGRGRAVRGGKPPDGSQPPPDSTTPPPDDARFDRLADLLGGLFSQSVYVPEAGAPQVIPTQSESQSFAPVLIIVAGVAFIGYMYIKRNKMESH